MEHHRRSWWLILVIFILIGIGAAAVVYSMQDTNSGIVEKTIALQPLTTS